MGTDEVKLPFYPRFEEPILRGRKTKTARTKRYGDPGDVLKTPWCRVRLHSVRRLPLREIAEHHYQDEGVDSPEEFREVWKEIHPRKGWDPTWEVFLHEFRRLPPSRDDYLEVMEALVETTEYACVLRNIPLGQAARLRVAIKRTVKELLNELPDDDEEGEGSDAS